MHWGRNQNALQYKTQLLTGAALPLPCTIEKDLVNVFERQWVTSGNWNLNVAILQDICFLAQQGEVQSPAPGEEQHHAPIRLGASQLENILVEKDLGVMVDTRPNVSQQCALAAKGSDTLSCQSQARWSFLSIKYWWSHTSSAVSSSGLLRKTETWAYWRESNDGLQGRLRVWSISLVRKGWDSWGCLAQRRYGSGGSYQHVQVPEGRVQRGSVAGPEAMGTTWNTGGSLWTSGKGFWQWGWLSTGTVAQGGCGVFADIPKPSRQALGQPILHGLTRAGGLDQMTSRGPFQPQPADDSMIPHMVL